MAKTSKKTEYIEANKSFLIELSGQDDIGMLPGGSLYRVISPGEGRTPSLSDVVSVYYRGQLINGHVFDDNMQQSYPDTFRVRELIEGWQQALLKMNEGAHWMLYVPAEQGYGKRANGDIPGNSTLIFELKLEKVY